LAGIGLPGEKDAVETEQRFCSKPVHTAFTVTLRASIGADINS